jgi:chemotaxis protein MotB
MPENKLARVMGMSSSIPLDTDNPLAPANRRISILVMTREAEARLLGTQRQTSTAIIETGLAKSP